MILSAWRIYKPRHSKTAFTGEGARLFGGRFNSKGIAIVYASESISLASLEMLVHLQSADILGRYVLREAKFDSRLVKSVDKASLPSNWRDSPASPAVQKIGDDWVAAGTSAVLCVPSVIISDEMNFLLNPAHPDFAKITIGPERPHKFDPRLLKTNPARER